MREPPVPWPHSGRATPALRDAIARTITTLPELLRQSLAWDQGAEMAQHPNRVGYNSGTSRRCGKRAAYNQLRRKPKEE